MSRTLNAQVLYSSPIPTNATKAAVSGFAEQLATRFRFGPSDLIKLLVTRMGGRIEYRNPDLSDPTRLPESIIVYDHDNFVVFVPNITSSERDRFTIAHELGHYFLHYPLARAAHPDRPMMATRWVDENNPEQKRAEWEANWFAGAFLMPGASFHSTYDGAEGDLQQVANYFGVSRRAAEVRASILGLE